MPVTSKLDPADRNKPRAVNYVYESLSGSTIEKISYVFSQDWVKAKIAGDNALIKDFMTKNGFTYKGKEKIDEPFMKADLYQYYNAQLGIYFEYSLVFGIQDTSMGVFTKTPTVTF